MTSVGVPTKPIEAKPRPHFEVKGQCDLSALGSNEQGKRAANSEQRAAKAKESQLNGTRDTILTGYCVFRRRSPSLLPQ